MKVVNSLNDTDLKTNIAKYQLATFMANNITGMVLDKSVELLQLADVHLIAKMTLRRGLKFNDVNQMNLNQLTSALVPPVMLQIRLC